jgi:hypothetical protein
MKDVTRILDLFLVIPVLGIGARILVYPMVKTSQGLVDIAW